MKCIAFGAGTQGQLGNGLLLDQLLPTKVSLNHDTVVKEVACGGNHALCLSATSAGAQQLYVWGLDHLGNNQAEHSAEPCNSDELHHNQSQQQRELTGISCSTHPLPVPRVSATPRQVQLPGPGLTIKRVAAGWAHTLLLTDAGQLYVAGDNSSGQLGLGQHVDTTQAGLVQLQLQEHLQQQLLAAKHGSEQQLVADAAAADASPAAAPRWRAVDVAAGMRHSLVLLHINATCQQQQQQGSTSLESLVMGCGSNKRRQLGCMRVAAVNGADNPSSSHMGLAAAAERAMGQGNVWWHPSLADIPDQLSRLSAGGERSAGISKQGQLLLWGRPMPGQPGAGDVQQATASDSGSNTGTSSKGKQHCVYLPQPWAGANPLESNTPCAIQQPVQWADVRLGWRHLIALDSAGQVWTAGDNSLGQLGVSSLAVAGGHQHWKEALDEARQAALHGPLQLPAPALCIAAGAEHCAAVLSNGNVYTWGWGEHGQLGTGSTKDTALPQQVATNWHATSVACGSGFTVLSCS